MIPRLPVQLVARRSDGVHWPSFAAGAATCAILLLGLLRVMRAL